MSTQVQAALIAGVVAFATALIGSVVNILQARRERSRWLVDLKASYTLELYRQRLTDYPQVFKIIGRLSDAAIPEPDSSVAGVVAGELNDWLYGAGGLCAEAGTRGAILGLRECCRAWARTGDHSLPRDLYQWRNVALAMLRSDIDVVGLEQYEFDNMPSALQRLKREVEQTINNEGMSRSNRLGRFSFVRDGSRQGQH